MKFIATSLPAFGGTAQFNIKAIDSTEVAKQLKEGSFVSLITEKGLASVLSNYLTVPIPVKTMNLKPSLNEDTIILVQTMGTEIKDSDVSIPKDCAIQFSVVDSKSTKATTYGFKKAFKEWLLKE